MSKHVELFVRYVDITHGESVFSINQGEGEDSQSFTWPYRSITYLTKYKSPVLLRAEMVTHYAVTFDMGLRTVTLLFEVEGDAASCFSKLAAKAFPLR